MTPTDLDARAARKRKAVRIAGFAVIPVALLLSGGVVAGASYSAFSSTTSNPTENWTTGSVALSDDDSNTALFNASNLKPGSTGTKCITITSSGSLPSAVKLYGSNPATTNSFSSYIDVAVTAGTGGSFGSCTGFTPLSSGSSVYTGTLAAFGTSATNYSTGLGSWSTTGSGDESRTYEVTYTVDPATPNTAQGSTASIGLTWEAQNS